MSDARTPESEPWLQDATLRATLEALPEGVGLTADGVIRYANSAIGATLGRDPADFLGTSPTEWLHPDDRERAARSMQEIMAAGRGDPNIYRFRHADGSFIPLEILSRRVELSGTGVLVTVFRDVRERLQREERTQLLSTAVDQAGEIVMITDIEGTIRYVNPAFHQVTGYASDEVVGRNPRLLRSGEQDAEFYRELWETILAGESWKGRIVNRRKDGSKYVQESTISPVRDGAGQLSHFVSVSRDVTALVALEEQLRESQKMEAIGQITAGVAHDFNNLLTVISANAEMVSSGLGDDHQELRELVGDLQESARNGAELVRQLMMFSRRRSLQLETVDVAGLVERLTGILGRLLPERIELRSEVADDVPAVTADPGSLEQMIISIATNARDAMPDGGSLRLEVNAAELDGDAPGLFRWGEPGRYVRVSLADSGRGMPEEVAARAFEPLFTTKPPGQGTGLGLSVVYGLMRSHKGAIALSTTEGEGTTVALYFPSANAETGSGQRAEPSVPGGSETVLLVEDSRSVRLAGKRVLERLGYTVLVARHGTEALAVLDEDGPRVDLVLSDMVMPVMGGLELRDRARDLGWPGPFILTSGYSQHEMTVAQDKDGPAFLPKPWSTAKLAQTVREALDRSKGG